jgi:TonB family protein
MRYSSTSNTIKLKSFSYAVFIMLSWTQAFSQTDAYNNRINWQDCIEVTYWDRDYLACGRDKSNYPNCRAIKFRNKCQETIYVTLYWITSDGTKKKHGSGEFKSGNGTSGVGGGWWTYDAVAYEFEVGPPNESNGITFPSTNRTTNTNNTANITSEYLQQQREEEAKKRRLEEQRKLQEYKAEQMRKHDVAYRSSQNQTTNSYSNQQTNKTYSQNNSYDNSAELKRKQDEAIAQQNMQRLQGTINQIKANDAAMQKASQQMQQQSNMIANRIAAEMEREEEERRRNEIKEAEEKRIKEEERKEKEAIASIKQTYLNFIRSQKSDWPNSSFSNYSVLYYYTISILEDNVIFSNVFSVGRNSGGSWPYKIDVTKEIETDFERTLGKKPTGLIFVGYYLSLEDAAYSKRNLEDEARASYFNSVSLSTKNSFGSTTLYGTSTKTENNLNDPWTGKPKLNPESIGTANDIPKIKKEGNDPWSVGNKTNDTNQTKTITNQEEAKKVNATIKANTASDPWSNPVIVKSSDNESDKKNVTDLKQVPKTVIEPDRASKTENLEKENTILENTSEAMLDIKKDESGRIYSIAEKNAQPKNGMETFYELIAQNLKYPTSAKINKVEGKVFVEFVVNTDGTITDLKVTKSLPHGCDQEAIRLIKESSPWIPAQNGNMIVRQKVVHPITFKLKP